MSLSLVLQLALNGILAACIYALVGGGISFLYATSRIFHLAHGVVVVAGGYAFWWAWKVLGWSFVPAVLLAVIAAAVFGVAMNEFVYEVLRKRKTKGLGYLITTLAMLVMGAAVIMLIFGTAPKTFSVDTGLFHAGGVTVTGLQLVIIGVSIVLLAAFFMVVRYTKFGKAMRASADNEAVARILGVNTKMIRRTSFALSSVLAAAGGILSGLEFNLDPNMGILLMVRGFAAAVIGGVGSFGGAVVGALIIGFLEQGVAWFWGAGWRNTVTFILLFVFLLVKPSGLFGSKREA